jgi:hypothetical protein
VVVGVVRRALGAVVLLGATGVVLLVPAPAHAHPFGPPQTLAIEAGEDAGSLRLSWLPGAADDFSYLAVGIGLVAQDRTQGSGGLLYVKKDADRLARSPELVEYVEEHVVATSGGRPCSERVVVGEHLVGDGVVIDVDCGASAEDVDLEVSMMTDLHPAYRTLATGPHGQRYVYTAEHTAHGWSLTSTGATAGSGRSAVLQLSGVVLAVGAAGAAGVAATRVARKRVPA